QAWPDRPLHFVVPYAPGGSTDTSARIVAEKLSALLGQPVLVENKPGGGTIIGTEAGARATPAGLTRLATPAAPPPNARVGVSAPAGTAEGRRPGAAFVVWRMSTAASNQARFKTMPELLAWPATHAAAPIAYASAGVGSLTHLWGEYVKARTRLPLEHVGYKGSADALKDVMAGHVPLFSDVLVPTAAAGPARQGGGPAGGTDGAGVPLARPPTGRA